MVRPQRVRNLGEKSKLKYAHNEIQIIRWSVEKIWVGSLIQCTATTTASNKNL